jgi:hypothetical protein
MSRNLDVLVEAHVRADARRRRGLPSWAYTVPIAPLIEALRAELTPETIATACLEIARRLKEALPAAWLDGRDRQYDRDFDEFIDRMEGTTAEHLRADRECDPVEFLDAALEELYDWADLKRVSLGLPGRPC